jgi:NadR type nicotinamide-nucleotide adenylyltransferase
MLKKIVVIGPESTGKSTLSKALATYFSCPWVPEYAREYLEELNRPYNYQDLLKIAKGQLLLEDKLSDSAYNFLICDTDLHVIQVWSEHKYGKVDPWIKEQLKVRKYDAYLITNIDTPWEYDPQREHPQLEMRQFFMNWYRKIVQESGIPYLEISGTLEKRLEEGVRFIESLANLKN